MTALDILYLEVNIVAILLMIVVLVKSIENTNLTSQRTFVGTIIVQLVFAISDTLFAASARHLLPYNGFFLLLMRSIYFASGTALAFSWYVYFEKLKGNEFVESKTNLIPAGCLCYVMLYYVFKNIVKHSLFLLNAEGFYERGPWYVAVILIPYIYILISTRNMLESAYQLRRSPDGFRFLTYAMCPIVVAAAGILQFINADLPFVNICLAMASLLIYLGSLDNVVSVDPLTHLPNRRQFMRSMGQWMALSEEDIPMFFMIMDVDKFKIINDNYGHTEGDYALVRVAESLTFACSKQRKKSTISRFGGDEFVILVEADNEDEIRKLITQINRTVTEKNQAAKAPYKLGLSIGYARLDEAKSVKGVIDIADERLYKIKEVHHRIMEAEEEKAKKNAEKHE